jgi:hypothetical protein
MQVLSARKDGRKTMGWRTGKFPVFSQLNLLTNQRHIDATHDFFVQAYGADGAGYKLGDLCMNWDQEDPITNVPPPPWEEDRDNPWNRDDASDWYAHCQVELDNLNTGSVDGGAPSGQSVRADLEDWIKDAIINKKSIKYKYKTRPGYTVWRADLEVHPVDPNRLRIIVRGPGF